MFFLFIYIYTHTGAKKYIHEWSTLSWRRGPTGTYECDGTAQRITAVPHIPEPPLPPMCPCVHAPRVTSESRFCARLQRFLALLPSVSQCPCLAVTECQVLIFFLSFPAFDPSLPGCECAATSDYADSPRSTPCRSSAGNSQQEMAEHKDPVHFHTGKISCPLVPRPRRTRLLSALVPEDKIWTKVYKD